MTSPTPPRSGSPPTSRRKRRRKDPAPLAAAFARYAGAAPRAASARPRPADPFGIAAAADAWTDVAGPDRAGSIPVRRSRAGVVTVACTDAGLAQKLAFRADALADALGAALGEPVRGLRFTVADHAIPPPAGPAARAPVTPTAAARGAARGLVAEATDPALRAALEAAAAAAIQRAWDTK